ncbi:MAG: xanthine dehydrogenase family protein subunit M [Halolamina sp.]
MFPPAFDYRKPADLDAALAALAPEDAVPLAGGHDLVPKLKDREEHPGTVVDLGALDDLRGVEREQSTEAADAGERLVIGALTTYADLLDADPAGVGGLLEATAAVGDTQIRNRGTVGGNLVAAHPASDLPAAALVADATLTLVGPEQERIVAVEEFYDADGETVCRSDELLTRLTVHTVPTADSAYARKTHPSSGYAAVGVAARVELDDGAVADAAVAANGLRPGPTRLTDVEEALVGIDADPTAEQVAEAAEQATEVRHAERVRDDHLVSAEQRLRLLPSYTEQAVSKALARAAEKTGVSA